MKCVISSPLASLSTNRKKMIIIKQFSDHSSCLPLVSQTVPLQTYAICWVIVVVLGWSGCLNKQQNSAYGTGKEYSILIKLHSFQLHSKNKESSLWWAQQKNKRARWCSKYKKQMCKRDALEQMGVDSLFIYQMWPTSASQLSSPAPCLP